jgi:hypothetical protein
MQFLVLGHGRADVPTAAMAPHLTAEAARSWRYYLDGYIRQAYFRMPPAVPGAVLVIEADGLDHARRLMDAMPLQQAGLVTFEVIPIGPFLPWDSLLPAGSPRPEAVPAAAG